ncbi:hypothetical protein LMIY3S_04810 [Labrys miyagiensis]
MDHGKDNDALFALRIEDDMAGMFVPAYLGSDR